MGWAGRLAMEFVLIFPLSSVRILLSQVFSPVDQTLRLPPGRSMTTPAWPAGTIRWWQRRRHLLEVRLPVARACVCSMSCVLCAVSCVLCPALAPNPPPLHPLDSSDAELLEVQQGTEEEEEEYSTLAASMSHRKGRRRTKPSRSKSRRGPPGSRRRRPRA